MATIPLPGNTSPAGNVVMAVLPTTKPSEKSPEASDDDDNTVAIIVGVFVPLVILIIVVLVIVYIVYRRKYPVRMIIGRGFAKVRNPNYDRPVSSATLVRDDADAYFSSQRGSVALNHNEFNPVNPHLHYDNMGYQRDEEEIVPAAAAAPAAAAVDEEDSADKEFRLRKGWLFKNNAGDDDSVEIVNETGSRGDEDNKATDEVDYATGSDSSDIEALLAAQQVTPKPNRKKRTSSSSSSLEEEVKNRSLSNTSVSSRDSNWKNVREREGEKLNLDSLENKSSIAIFEPDEMIPSARSIRSHSLDITVPQQQARPRSFSVDPSKSARKYSLRTEVLTKSANAACAHNPPQPQISAFIVGVVIHNEDGSFFSSESSLSASMREHALSLSSVNSNPHLVTDLDDSSDTDAGAESTEADANDGKSRNSDDAGGLTMRDLEPAVRDDDENTEPVVTTRGLEDEVTGVVESTSGQHEEGSSATTEISLDNSMETHANDRVSQNPVNEELHETLDVHDKSRSEYHGSLNQFDITTEPNIASSITLGVAPTLAKEIAHVEIQDDPLTSHSDLQHEVKPIGTQDHEITVAVTPKDADDLREVVEAIEGQLPESLQAHDHVHAQYYDDTQEHPTNNGEDSFILLDKLSSAPLGNADVTVKDSSLMLDVDCASVASENVKENSDLSIENQANYSKPTNTSSPNSMLGQRNDLALELNETQTDTPKNIPTSGADDPNNLSPIIDPNSQIMSSSIISDQRSTTTDELSDSFVILDKSFSDKGWNMTDGALSGDELSTSYVVLDTSSSMTAESVNDDQTISGVNKQSDSFPAMSELPSKQAETPPKKEITVIEGDSSDDSDQESSSATSSESGGHFEKYSFHNSNEDEDQDEEVEYAPESNTASLHSPSPDRSEMIFSERKYTPSQELGAEKLDFLSSIAEDDNGESSFPQQETSVKADYLLKSYDSAKENQSESRPTDLSSENYDWFKSQYANLGTGDSETELQPSTKTVTIGGGTTSDDVSNSSISSDEDSIDVDDISLSDIEDADDLRPKTKPSVIGVTETERNLVGRIDESGEESSATSSRLGFYPQAASSSPAIHEDEKDMRKNTGGRLKIVPTLQFSDGSSDSDDQDNDFKPEIRLETHPQRHSFSKVEETDAQPILNLSSNNDVTNASGFSGNTSTNQVSEQRSDVSFSFDIAKTYHLDNKRGDDEEDDIDV